MGKNKRRKNKNAAAKKAAAVDAAAPEDAPLAEEAEDEVAAPAEEEQEVVEESEVAEAEAEAEDTAAAVEEEEEEEKDVEEKVEGGEDVEEAAAAVAVEEAEAPIQPAAVSTPEPTPPVAPVASAPAAPTAVEATGAATAPPPPVPSNRMPIEVKQAPPLPVGVPRGGFGIPREESDEESEEESSDDEDGATHEFKVLLASDQPRQGVKKFKEDTVYRIYDRANRSKPIVRKHSDFLWLQGKILQAFPGLIIPLVPNDDLFAYLSPEAVEFRRKAAENLLNHAMSRRKVRQLDATVLFVDASKESIEFVKQTTRARGKSIGQRLKEFKFEFLDTIGSKPGPTERGIPTDADFAEYQAYCDTLLGGVKWMQKRMAQLSGKTKDKASVWSQLGTAMDALASNEQEASALANVFAAIGARSRNMSGAGLHHVDVHMAELQQRLSVYETVVLGLKSALSSRDAMRKTLLTLHAEIRSKQNKHKKMVGGFRPNADKIRALEGEINKTMEAANRSIKEVQRVEDTIRKEMDAFHNRNARTFVDLMLSHARNELEYLGQLQEQWVSLIPHLERVKDQDTVDGETPTPSTTPMPQ